ncbi:MAG TPA: hypothetical protein PKA41_06415, partial [Verrucomicrobiota bacterium]|nr:hypothetical protein [Verrucomicrobiota bacterium]
SVALKSRMMMVAVAVIVALAIILGTRLAQRTHYAEDDSFAAYRSKMVRTVLRTYAMDLETDDIDKVRSFLAQNQSVSDWVLPTTLQNTTATGCGILRWQGRPVSMICFHSGGPLDMGVKTDVFLFVIENSSLVNPPQSATVEISRVNDLITASWSEGGKTYVLAGDGDEVFIRRFL